MSDIEDIILENDLRGISALRRHLPDDYCDRAARLITDNSGTAFIATGFYILKAEAAETDGPPGAIAIGRAIEQLGYSVKYVTDQYCSPILSAIGVPANQLIDFPISDHEQSKNFADDLINKWDPSILISIERCGMSSDGLYRNMRGMDITRFTAHIDYIFQNHETTIGIGDGGNEIGMGALAELIPKVPSLVELPSVTKTSELILSSVSNWGGYGLITALSKLINRNLLLSTDEEQSLIKESVKAGAVDGVLGESINSVDALDLEQNATALVKLHSLMTGLPN
ncbi:MAG: DUF4392 domain-containing protein [Chloroflexota bacterium]|nr:DUF4392 domain-containing protein [Chloroflexota bacterium]